MAWAGGISWAFPVCAHCVWWTQITPLSASVGNAGACAEQLVCAGATARLLMDWNQLWNPQHMKTSLKLSLHKVGGLKKKQKIQHICMRGYKCNNNPTWCISCILSWLSATSYCWEHRVRQENTLIWCSFTKYEQSLQLTGSQSSYSAEESIYKNSKIAFVVSSYLKSQYLLYEQFRWTASGIVEIYSRNMRIRDLNI